MVLLDLICFAAAFTLLLAAIWLLQQCERLELSVDALLALAVGGAAAATVARVVSPRPMDVEHVILLVVAAAWVVRTLTRRRRALDRRASRAPS